MTPYYSHKYLIIGEVMADNRTRATTRLPKHLHDWLSGKAKKKGISINKVLTVLVSTAKAKDLEKQLGKTA